MRLTTTEGLAVEWLPEELAAFHARHPRIDVEVLVQNTALNLLRREADIAALRDFGANVALGGRRFDGRQVADVLPHRPGGRRSDEKKRADAEVPARKDEHQERGGEGLRRQLFESYSALASSPQALARLPAARAAASSSVSRATWRSRSR